MNGTLFNVFKGNLYDLRCFGDDYGICNHGSKVPLFLTSVLADALSYYDLLNDGTIKLEQLIGKGV